MSYEVLILSSEKNERRRGAVLETALLEAAWDELVEGGYGHFTMEAVVQRSGTSRPVLYRRWSSRAELAIAAIRHHARQTPIIVHDTGSLRDDLLALLRQVSSRRADMGLLVFVQMSEYFMETQSSPADLRASLIEGEQGWLSTIFLRAVSRGEIDGSRLTPRIASLPVNLLRHEVMMTLKPIPDAVIVEIVDNIFLPLVGKWPLPMP